MQEFQTENVRNVALIGHGDAGKTSLTECFLYSAKETNRLGAVDDGTTTSDYNQDEIERRISINTSIMHSVWKNNKINILDTPGFIDFNGEVKCALQAADIGVLVISAASGAEVGTEVVWGFCREKNKPAIGILNKLDRDNIKFDEMVSGLRDSFDSKLFPVQFPLTTGPDFNSIVDILAMKLFTFENDKTGGYIVEDIPADVAGKADDLKNELIELIAESDDDLLEKYLEEGELSGEEFKTGFQEAINSASIHPLLCCSSEKNAGPAAIMDFFIDYCPDPQAAVKIKAKKKDEDIVVGISKSDPVSVQIFKTISEQHVGELSFFKCIAGEVKPGLDLLNPNKNSKERLGQIYTMNGKNRKEVGIISAGDIGAVVKLKDTHTGNTLCAPGNEVIYEDIEFPNPVMRVSIQPKAKGDEAKIATGLNRLHEEDPSFNVNVDSELKQTILSCQGEMHIDIIMKRLKQKSNVEVEIGDPRIPFRETIKKSAKSQGKYKKQSGGRGQYGDAWLELTPNVKGGGFEFADNIVGGSIPSKYIPAIEKGVMEIMESGVIAGCKVVDVKTSVFDGSFHNVDSSDMAFKIAGSMAFRSAFMSCNPVLLEPIYEIEIKVPEEFMGDVMGDMSSRRGKILGSDSEGSFIVIKAYVPLAELTRYSTTLRSITSGRGIFKLKFSSYEDMPREQQQKVIQEYEESKKEA